jgi:hemerythrin
MDRAPTPATPEIFAWDDRFALGYAPMDAVHEQFVAQVAALLEAPDAQLRERLDALAAHLQEHFAFEDKLMRETEFPSGDCHIDEHAAVLSSVREVQELLAAQGAQAHPVDATRRLAVALRDWFPGHADHLDSALAAWLCKRSHGGKPVVLRRSLARNSGA